MKSKGTAKCFVKSTSSALEVLRKSQIQAAHTGRRHQRLHGFVWTLFVIQTEQQQTKYIQIVFWPGGGPTLSHACMYAHTHATHSCSTWEWMHMCGCLADLSAWFSLCSPPWMSSLLTLQFDRWQKPFTAIRFICVFYSHPWLCSLTRPSDLIRRKTQICTVLTRFHHLFVRVVQ